MPNLDDCDERPRGCYCSIEMGRFMERVEHRLDSIDRSIKSLGISLVDERRLAVSAAGLHDKTEALRAAVAEVPTTPPTGA